MKNGKRKGYRWIVSVALAMLMIWNGTVWVTAKGNGDQSWYCVRAKDHRQPVADADLSYVEGCGAYYIDHAHSDPDGEEKVVYLTFDVGYENGNVAKTLDALKGEGVTAAFFILGHVAEACPDLVKRMAEEGHLVCNHTYSHRNMTGWSAEEVKTELKKMEDTCLAATGVTMSPYFRPPEGRFDRQLLEDVKSLGYRTVFWSFAYADWDNKNQPDPVAAQKKILDNIHNGAVVLLHPTSATNAQIIGDVVAVLKNEGYRFGTLNELIEASGDDLPQG